MSTQTIALQALFLFLALCARAQERPLLPQHPENVSSVAVLAPPEEPGERLVIQGTIYHADGVRPYNDFLFYLYQTDASGVYNNVDGNWQNPRLRGWLRTGPNGSYEIRTIKPGSYPGSRNPAHIHAVIQLPGQPAQWIDDFLFEDDPYITDNQRFGARQKNRFSHILKLSRNGDGGYAGVRDIRIPE